MAAVLFVVFFFLHCDFRLSSWYTRPIYLPLLPLLIHRRDYFIASGAIYLLSLFSAHIRTYLMHGIHTATLELLPSGLVRVTVPTVITWAPGQHVFVRFLTTDLHLLTAHPFTISSACRNPDETGKASQLVFYIKPHSGITGRLATLAGKQPGVSKKVFIEGPYGGVSTHHMAHFDTILVIAGGSGGGFSLAIVDEVLRQFSQQASTTTTTPTQYRRPNLQVVFSTRNASMVDWYTEEIESRLSQSTTLSSNGDHDHETSVSVHISSNPDSTISSSTLDTEKTETGKTHATETTTTGSFSLNVHRYCRPDIPALLAHTITAASAQMSSGGKKPRVGVLVCGPASMLHDTRNAAAQAQAWVLKGEIEELYLHTEPFA